MNRMNQKKELDYSWNIPRHQRCKSEKHDFHLWNLTSWWLKANAQHWKEEFPCSERWTSIYCYSVLRRRDFIFTYILKLKQANSVGWARINSRSVLRAAIALHIMCYLSHICVQIQLRYACHLDNPSWPWAYFHDELLFLPDLSSPRVPTTSVPFKKNLKC